MTDIHTDLPSGEELETAILLVEDDDMVREALLVSLQFMGYTVYDVASGVEALGLAGRMGEKIDLVISDLVMPGMNALELYEALKLVPYNGKMLILTGYPMPQTGMSLAVQPGVRWARKPIQIDELEGLVGQMLGSSSSLV